MPEIRGETPSDTEVLVKICLKEKMNISKEDVDEIGLSVSIVCQLDVTKLTLISLDLSSQNLVSTKANNLYGSSVKNVEDTGIGFSRDYPKEIYDIHAKLLSVFL